MADDFPPKIGAPATRALAAAGITSLAGLAKWTEADLLALHGMGPKAVGILRATLTDEGASFRSTDVPVAKDASGTDAVDAYLADLPSPQQETLAALRATLRSILPHAEEAMKYGMPALAIDGKAVAGYAAFKDHCGYFPMSGEVIDAAGSALSGYQTSKGGISFGVDERPPVSLLRRLVKLRLAELSAVENGRRYEYHPDGRVKAVGPMKDGELDGKWKWFRRDGTLMRTGQFSHGEQVETWTTWGGDGNPVKTTRF